MDEPWFPRLATGPTGSAIALHRGMRLVAGLLALTLTGSLAFAEEPKAPEAQSEPTRGKVPLRLVTVWHHLHHAQRDLAAGQF